MVRPMVRAELLPPGQLMPTDPREAAWFAVHDALPAYWAL
jgi:hypothetical protein